MKNKKPVKKAPKKPCKKHEYSLLYNDGENCINCGARRPGR
ncbi:MAG TPA: hypothetical protein PKA34_29310 [Blastocatellia bacterium]|nr:hypothetical protein [Blastocatellia bacterium]HNG31806.1 hypothetical protein [Blastocatellia bacterium]